jgi:hypothetical protein
MAQQTWTNLLNWGVPWQTSVGTAVATAATATISPQAAGSQDFVLPTQSTGTQFYEDMTLKLEANLNISSGSTASNLTLLIACGASGTLGTTLCTTSAMALGTGSLAGLEATLSATIRCIGVGSSGNTLSTEGLITVQTSTAALAIGTTNVTVMPLPLTSVAYNTYTAATALGIRGTLSTANGSAVVNSFQIYQVA